MGEWSDAIGWAVVDYERKHFAEKAETRSRELEWEQTREFEKGGLEKQAVAAAKAGFIPIEPRMTAYGNLGYEYGTLEDKEARDRTREAQKYLLQERKAKAEQAMLDLEYMREHGMKPNEYKKRYKDIFKTANTQKWTPEQLKEELGSLTVSKELAPYVDTQMRQFSHGYKNRSKTKMPALQLKVQD